MYKKKQNCVLHKHFFPIFFIVLTPSRSEGEKHFVWCDFPPNAVSNRFSRDLDSTKIGFKKTGFNKKNCLGVEINCSKVRKFKSPI